MRILHSWLQRYIKFKIPAGELVERLGMRGLEIVGIDRLDEKYRGFVVGQVMEKQKHPNADKLSLCTVNVGKEALRIVCGAPNVAVGQKVAVGQIGASVPRNQHDPAGGPFALSRVTIRGVESFGMICSEYELDLGKDADGILVLEPGAKVGRPLAEYLDLNDVAYETEITPNRPDWLSHFGVAREIGALVGRMALLPRVRLKESATPIARHLSVTIQDRKNCPRFAARVIQGVTITPSPRWLQNALRNVGLRPRNNVVDVTNYVMLECGQPLHAFDHALLKGGRIIVRQAETGKRFTTLDGKEHELPAGAVMVCDAEREVSIAGIMGGANSEINDSTRDIVLEAAYWRPSSIRRTARALGISTDASQRFERGTDPEGVRYAIDRAAALILETAGGTLLKGVRDVRAMKETKRTVSLRTARVNEILGTTLTQNHIIRLLASLGITVVRKGKDPLLFRIPSFRVDIDREIDLIEEVARAFGYDNIEERTTASVNFAQPFPREDATVEIRGALIGLGFQEAISSSLQDRRTALLAGPTPVGLLNAANQEMSTLRTSLLPGLLQSVARNGNFGTSSVRLFEIGHVYAVDDGSRPRVIENFLEDERACMVLTGMASPRHWSEKPRPVDIFDIKGDVQNLLAKIALDKSRFIYYSTSNPLAGNTVAVEINGSYAGCFGEASSEMLKAIGIEQAVFFAELDLRPLSSSKLSPTYASLPRFPRVRRDVAFVVDTDVDSERVEQVIRAASSGLLQSVEVFDVYRGEGLAEGKKSLAYTLDLMSTERTLTDREIEAEVTMIVQRVEKEAGAVLRAE